MRQTSHRVLRVSERCEPYGNPDCTSPQPAHHRSVQSKMGLIHLSAESVELPPAASSTSKGWNRIRSLRASFDTKAEFAQSPRCSWQPMRHPAKTDSS